MTGSNTIEHQVAARSTQDILDYIEHQVFQQVLNDSRHVIPIQTRESSIQLATTDTDNLEFRLEPDGTISATDPIMLADKLRAPGSFRNAWRYLHDHILSLVLTEMEYNGICRLRPGELPWDDDPIAENPGEAPRSVISRDTIFETAQRAARTLMGCLGNGYPRNPSFLGAHYLHQLIGPPKVSQTLRTAGGNATIEEHNIVTLNPGTIGEAHRQNPNAVVLWFAQKLYLISPEQITPDGIINQAKSSFNELRERDRLHRRDTEEAWQALTGMNRLAVNHFPPVTTAHQALINAILLTGVQPPYSIIRHTVKGSKYQIKGCDKNLASLVRAGAMSRRKRGSNLRDLIQAHQQSHEDEQPKRKPAQRKPRQKPAQKATRKDIIRMLQGPTGQELLESIRGIARIETEPGDSVTLWIRGEDQPALRVESTPGQALHITSNGTWSPELPILRGSKPLVDWTTRGRWSKTARETGADIVSRNWDAHGPGTTLPSRNRTMSAVTEYLQDLGINEQSISQPLRDGLQTLLSTHTLDLAKRVLPVVNIHRYNLACLGPQGIEHLMATNPGALVWAFRFGRPTEEIKHPGQITRLARSGLLELGVNERHWRFITRISQEDMTRITGELELQQAANMLKMSARHGALPSTRVFRQITRLKMQTAQPGRMNPKILEDNLDRATGLALQESAQTQDNHHPTEEDLQMVWDYAEQMARNHQEVRSRTWRGILRRSNEWHQTMRAGPTLRQWDGILQAQEGRYLAWNSAIEEPLQDRGYTITPLTSQEQLKQESLRMEHCVIHYGDRCASGQSRIFSVTLGDRAVATMEIAPKGNPRGTQGEPNGRSYRCRGPGTTR